MAAAKSDPARLINAKDHRGPAWVAGAVLGGALLFGTCASFVDPKALGIHTTIVLLCVLLAAYLAFVLVVRAWAPAQLHGPRIEDFLALSPGDFESVVGALLERAGYADVRRVGGSGDLGVDLTCRDMRGREVVVQCKRYAPGQRIGSPVIQTFIGMAFLHHEAHHAIFVTTADFTGPARDLAAEHGITLVDGAGLLELVAQVNNPGPRRVIERGGETPDEQAVGDANGNENDVAAALAAELADEQQSELDAPRAKRRSA